MRDAQRGFTASTSPFERPDIACPRLLSELYKLNDARTVPGMSKASISGMAQWWPVRTATPCWSSNVPTSWGCAHRRAGKRSRDPWPGCGAHDAQSLDLVQRGTCIGKERCLVGLHRLRRRDHRGSPRPSARAMAPLMSGVPASNLKGRGGKGRLLHTHPLDHLPAGLPGRHRLQQPLSTVQHRRFRWGRTSCGRRTRRSRTRALARRCRSGRWPGRRRRLRWHPTALALGDQRGQVVDRAKGVGYVADGNNSGLLLEFRIEVVPVEFSGWQDTRTALNTAPVRWQSCCQGTMFE